MICNEPEGMNEFRISRHARQRARQRWRVRCQTALKALVERILTLGTRAAGKAGETLCALDGLLCVLRGHCIVTVWVVKKAKQVDTLN
jgi:hypothetical protein